MSDSHDYVALTPAGFLDFAKKIISSPRKAWMRTTFRIGASRMLLGRYWSVIVYALWWDKPLSPRFPMFLPIRGPVDGLQTRNIGTNPPDPEHLAMLLAQAAKIPRSLGGTISSVKRCEPASTEEERRLLIEEEEIGLSADINEKYASVLGYQPEIPKALQSTFKIRDPSYHLAHIKPKYEVSKALLKNERQLELPT
ncbi:hypothetical protein K440DRAFT_670021 [Wilcoxina mikolae CBS 423.85]|nr:hypothetical protein K440DRAFT_670021 [Wilcoxina mikolae CBS 423.85]